MSLIWSAYRLVAPALGALAPAAKLFTSPHERAFWSERMGEVRLDAGCDAWIHAASLGEAAAVPPFVAELVRVAPEARFWLSSTTRTGRNRLQACGAPVSLAPIDSPQATRRFFAGIRPRRLLLIETELWPHWLLHARAERLPVAVVSARLSERSVRHYRSLGSELRGLVGSLAAVLCQGEEDRRRWLDVGAAPERTRVVGNLKSDGLPAPADDKAEARAMRGLDPDRPLLVLGSLRPGEAHALGRAWSALPEALRRQWQVVAVPRHPRASEELREELEGTGVRAAPDLAGRDVWLWDDRTGVLVEWYAAADVAFVGGSLVALGGHNPLEPAACGAAVLMGPHHASQRESVRALLAAGGLRVAASGPELARALDQLLGDAAVRERVAGAALAVARAQKGAARRAVDTLVEMGLWPA